MMEIQKQILLFFAGIHNGFLNALVQVFTICGEEFVLIALAAFIYYNIDKKSGFISSMSLMNAISAMGIVKAIVRFPRPWMVLEGIDPIRMHTATGYSFPSGHTTCAASAYSSFAMCFRKRWISVTCAIMILLVAVSRMYLCVHWPMDVVGGILIGCGTTFTIGRLFGRLHEDKEKAIKVTMVLGIAACAASIGLSVLLMAGKAESLAFDDLNISFATYGGLALGYSIERRFLDFEVGGGSWGKKILRYLVTMAVVAVMLFGLKPLLVSLDIYNSLTRALRYFLVGLWCTLFPLVGRKMRLF